MLGRVPPPPPPSLGFGSRPRPPGLLPPLPSRSHLGPVEGLSPRSVFDIRKMLLARFHNAVMEAVESTEVKEQEMGTLAASQNVV